MPCPRWRGHVGDFVHSPHAHACVGMAPNFLFTVDARRKDYHGEQSLRTRPIGRTC